MQDYPFPTSVFVCCCLVTQHGIHVTLPCYIHNLLLSTHQISLFSSYSSSIVVVPFTMLLYLCQAMCTELLHTSCRLVLVALVLCLFLWSKSTCRVSVNSKHMQLYTYLPRAIATPQETKLSKVYQSVLRFELRHSIPGKTPHEKGMAVHTAHLKLLRVVWAACAHV